MAKFETIVRPVVFPNIRPGPARTLPPEDNPEEGFAVIRGNPAQIIELSYSYSFSATSSNTDESKRQVDTVRVYQQDDDGTINHDNFVDVDVANKLWIDGRAPIRSSNPDAGMWEKKKWTETFKPAEEDDNIEIRARNQIKKNPNNP